MTAGRILIMPRGDYDVSTTYEMLDLVNYNKATWICKREAVGIEPSDINSAYWFRILGVGILNSAVIANNLTTTAEGMVLDARQGKTLMDAITSANAKSASIESSLNETKTALNETKTSLAGTASKVATAETTIASLNTSVSKLQGNATITKGTLAIGATSLVLNDARITANSVLSIYTSVWGVNPTAVAIASGKVTMTFDVQTVAVEVGVRVDG